MPELLSKCGCDCGRCPAYHENAKTDADRKRCSEGWGKYLGAKLKPESCYCLGCHADDPWETGNVLPDSSCTLRPCVIKTGIENCAYCAEFPCDCLRMRIPDENFRAGIEARIGEPVPEEDYLAFIKPYEGIKNLSDIHEALKPTEIVEAPKPPPLRAKVAPFPENLALERHEQAGARALHQLLTQIITADTDTYSEQQALMRKMHNILSILWAFGQFGDFDVEDDGKIIINGGLYGSSKEFSNIVRKRDNTLHTPTRIAFTILERLGVYAEHVPVGKKTWVLTLTFDDEAGGPGAVRALHRYVTGLVERHGVPTYVGKSHYKGKAYDLFSQADMQYMK